MSKQNIFLSHQRDPRLFYSSALSDPFPNLFFYVSTTARCFILISDRLFNLYSIPLSLSCFRSLLQCHTLNKQQQQQQKYENISWEMLVSAMRTLFMYSRFYRRTTPLWFCCVVCSRSGNYHSHCVTLNNKHHGFAVS